jgi:hypothetical protein
MLKIAPTLSAKARAEAAEVELSDLISSDFLAADAVVQNTPPAYLHGELADHRLQLYDDRGRWLLAPFDE